MLLPLWLCTRPATTITATFASLVVVKPHEFFAAGSFVLTGKSAQLALQRKLIVGTASFVLSGQNAGLEKGRLLTAASGNFTEMVQAANLALGVRVAASGGSFMESGLGAGLLATRRLTIGGGSFPLSGQSATLEKGRTLNSAVGTFSETGVAASLKTGYRLAVGTGSFIETGVAATLTYTAIVSVDAVTSTTSGAASSITQAHTIGSTANALVVCVEYEDSTLGVSISGVTWNGTSMISAGLQDSLAGGRRTQIFYLTAPTTGAHNVVVTFSGSMVGAVVGITSLNNVNQSTPVGTFVSANGLDTAPTVNATSETRGLVIDSVVCSGAASATVGSGQTSGWNTSVGSPGITGAGSTEAGATTVTMSRSLSIASNWAIGALPIKPS